VGGEGFRDRQSHRLTTQTTTLVTLEYWKAGIME
jgi:hypothetical protein